MRSWLQTNRVPLISFSAGFVLVAALLLHYDGVLVRVFDDLYKRSPYAPVLEHFDAVVSFIGNGSTQVASALFLYLWGVFFPYRRTRRAGRTLLMAFLVSGCFAQVSKHLLGRARPRINFATHFAGPTLEHSMDSFPSGHTLVTFCLAHVLSFYFPRYRLWFYLAALIVGFERMLCATHFPSDVVAGALLGIAIAAALLGYTPTRPLSSSSYL